MPTYSEYDEMPFPLVHRTGGRGADLGDDDDTFHQDGFFAMPQDRISPAVSGVIVGFLAGCAAVGVVHALAPAELARPLTRAATLRGLAPEIGFVVAYVTAGSIGSLLGAAFAVVTRYLRKWFPLLIWALVFFTSLAMLVLAGASAYGRSVGPTMAGPILLGSAVFGFVLSFSLPLRRRR
jgi:hypothetical protein